MHVTVLFVVLRGAFACLYVVVHVTVSIAWSVSILEERRSGTSQVTYSAVYVREVCWGLL